jgi:hypothetical protein
LLNAAKHDRLHLADRGLGDHLPLAFWIYLGDEIESVLLV